MLRLGKHDIFIDPMTVYLNQDRIYRLCLTKILYFDFTVLEPKFVWYNIHTEQLSVNFLKLNSVFNLYLESLITDLIRTHSDFLTSGHRRK